MNIIELSLNDVDMLIEYQIEGSEICVYEVKIGGFVVDHLLSRKAFSDICTVLEQIIIPPNPYNAQLKA